MYAVFISYSRKDIDIAGQLAQDLEKVGLDAWWDISGLKGGDAWLQTIQAALKASKYCIVLLSPDGVESEWVEKEYTYAMGQGLKVIPILYKDCEVPMALANIQYIDFRGKKYERGLQELFESLRVLAPDREGARPVPKVIRPPMKEKPAVWSGFSFWGLTVIALVTVLSVVIVAIQLGGPTVMQMPPSTPTPASFSYSARVQAKDTMGYVEDATVTMEVSGKAPLDGITDSKGFVRIIIPSSHAEKRGRLIVEAMGYRRYIQEDIDLTEGTLPHIIALEKEGSVGPSPTYTVTQAMPTVTPNPTPTNTPEPTPTPVFVEAPRELNLRASPSLRDRIIGTIPKGSLFEVLVTDHDDENREWALVRAKSGLQGWTFLGEDIVVEIPTPSGEFTPTVIPTPTPTP